MSTPGENDCPTCGHLMTHITGRTYEDPWNWYCSFCQEETKMASKNNGPHATANARQVGGSHYKTGGEEHWDRQWRLFGPAYFIGQITKYVERYQTKNGVQDLEKAKHFLEKLIELELASCNCGAKYNFTSVVHLPGCPAAPLSAAEPGAGYANQD